MIKPVAWRAKDYADGWILCHTEADAKLQTSGGLVEPLYSAATVKVLKEELASCRAAFSEASDAYSRLRWPDNTGQ